MNWSGLLTLLMVVSLAGYFVGLVWKKIDVLKLIAISVFLLFGGYVVISGFFFWADQYTIYQALLTEGLCFLLGCFYFIRKKKCWHFQVEWVKRDLVVFLIIVIGFLISFEKFDYFGMGQDEGVYQVKAIELIYGHEERQLDFEEYGFLETDEQREEYSQQVNLLLGLDRYNTQFPTLKEENRLSAVSGIFHGIPTFPALLALFGDIFGIQNMHQIHSILYLCAMLFLWFTAENLKLKRIPTYLVVALAALCPVVQWVTKSTLTECGLYFIMSAFMYAITSQSQKKYLFLAVAAIWCYGFYHVSAFAMMPMFVVLYFVLYFETNNRNYLYCNILSNIGFSIGCMMMLFVSPQYSFNNINNSIGTIGFDYIIPIMLGAAAVVIILNIIIDKVPIQKLYQVLRGERIFPVLLRVAVIACLCIIAVYAIRVHLGMVEVWRTDVQPYYQADTIIPIVQHLGITAMSVALGVIALPIAVLLLLIHPKEILKSTNTLVIGAMFLYFTILAATFMKIEIYYFYYYARYLAPFLVVAVVGIGVLFNQLKEKWTGVILVVSCAVLLPFDAVLLTEKDDSQLEWQVLSDIAEKIEQDGAVVIDANYQSLFMLPIKAMTNTDVYPLSDQIEEQLELLEGNYDNIYYIGNQVPDEMYGKTKYLYCNTYETSQDYLANLNQILLLPYGFSHDTAQVILMKYQGITTSYDFAHDILELNGFGRVESDKFRWIEGDEGTIEVYLEQEDYMMEIMLGSIIPLDSLKKDEQEIDVYVNGTYADTVILTKDNMKGMIDVPIDADMLSVGANKITFAGDSWSPSEYGSGDTRNLLIAISSIHFQPLSGDVDYLFKEELNTLNGFGNVENNSFRWIQGNEGSFNVYLNSVPYTMQIELGTAVPLGSLGYDSYQFDVLINDVLVDTVNLTQDTMDKIPAIEIPAEVLHSGYNTVTFRGETWSPSEYGSGDTRKLMIALEKVLFVPKTKQ